MAAHLEETHGTQYILDFLNEKSKDSLMWQSKQKNYKIPNLVARVDAVHIKNRVYQQDFSGIDILTSFSKYASEVKPTLWQLKNKFVFYLVRVGGTCLSVTWEMSKCFFSEISTYFPFPLVKGSAMYSRSHSQVSLSWFSNFFYF